MALPRSCAVCHGIHAAGQPCPTARQNREQRRGTTVQRFGHAWASVSRRIITRDNGRCHICGGPGADTVDHLTPRSLGGAHTEQNLAAAHRSCNSSKGAR